jgi:DNA-binding Lrp family transcriptional regulator
MLNDSIAQERLERMNKLSVIERRDMRTSTRGLGPFAKGFIGVRLRPYQLEAANAVIRSVYKRDGESFVILFARQSGKDELLADLILFLLARLSDKGTSIICAQPTFRPQTVNAMQRLEKRALQRPFFPNAGFRKQYGYMFSLLDSRVLYFSTDPSANVVGQTADRLLIINEAQDVRKSIYDRSFAPMAAAGNATRVFSGTAWTSDTLLEREKQSALQLEKRDGLKRVFVVTGEQVARHNKHYSLFLKKEIRKLGRDHPLIRTQYFCENIEAQSGMFTPAHRALMSGDEHRYKNLHNSVEALRSEVKNPTAFLLDVAGQEEMSTSFDPEMVMGRVAVGQLNPVGRVEPQLNTYFSDNRDSSGSDQHRDAVTLRIVEIDLSTLPTLQAPTYRAIYMEQWTGLNHLTVFGKIKALAEIWNPQHIVMDATGVGEGLWAMLDKALPTRVIPVKFSQTVKSELGYGFLAIINTGRFRDCVPCKETDRQYAACESEVLTGPARVMRWGVPEGRRDEDGHLIHDDIPVTDSLSTYLDRLTWFISTPTAIINYPDPLLAMDHNY